MTTTVEEKQNVEGAAVATKMSGFQCRRQVLRLWAKLAIITDIKMGHIFL
jgi:hypothetical protein